MIFENHQWRVRTSSLIYENHWARVQGYTNTLPSPICSSFQNKRTNLNYVQYLPPLTWLTCCSRPATYSCQQKQHHSCLLIPFNYIAKLATHSYGTILQIYTLFYTWGTSWNFIGYLQGILFRAILLHRRRGCSRKQNACGRFVFECPIMFPHDTLLMPTGYYLKRNENKEFQSGCFKSGNTWPLWRCTSCLFTQRNFLFVFGGPPYIHDYAFYLTREISGKGVTTLTPHTPVAFQWVKPPGEGLNLPF